ncbi:MAG: DNA methyltransferase [bacterium]
MQLTEHLIKKDFDSIPINPFWNTGDEKELKMHRIHAYPAKFPAFITTKAIQFAEENGVKVNTISDIFCGCGTTAFESRRNGKNFWGCDINPVATLIASVKSKTYTANTLLKHYNTIISNAQALPVTQDELKNVNERIKYWYPEEQIKDLLKLKKAIFLSVPQRSIYRNFFLVAFSNILKPTSMWLTKSIKPQYDPQKKPANVFEAFKTQYRLMEKSSKDVEFEGKTEAKIENINFLRKKIKRPKADLIVTSPPYVTSYEYADLHQLSSLWLDYTDDYRNLREGTIGSLHHNSNFKDDIKQLNKIGEAIVFKLYTVDKNKAKSAAKYFIDMQRAASKAYELLNAGGMALFVIGNTEYKSVKIDNAKHLVQSMESVGFNNIEISRRKIKTKILTPYRDEKGKFTTDSNSHKVYAEEFIVTGKKT